LADREDSIHLKIRIDVDEDDKAFTENLASNLAKTDEEKVAQQVREAGEIPENVEAEIKQLENEIKEIQKRIKKEKDPKDPDQLKAKLQAKKDALLIKEFKDGPVGMVHRFTQEQASNLMKFTSSPGQFFIAGLGKALKRLGGAATKGGIIGIIALIVYELTLFALDELMKPGRPLDRRFKRISRLETMNFYDRIQQEELRHGYQEIRVTTMAGLRGGQSQVNGNLFEFGSGAVGIIQSSPYRSSQEIYRSQNTSGAVTDSKGNPRRRSVGSTRYG
jgi:hypothetical protein